MPFAINLTYFMYLHLHKMCKHLEDKHQLYSGLDTIQAHYLYGNSILNSEH